MSFYPENGLNQYFGFFIPTFPSPTSYICNSIRLMAYQSLEQCLLDLEQHGQLIRVKEEVDPHLEMATIHHRVYEAGGPALLFENVKGSRFRTASNIFGSLERSRFIFRDTLDQMQKLIKLKNDPIAALKNPFQHLGALIAGTKAFPLRNPINKPVLFQEICIQDIPQIQHWPNDGGAFVTLPQVYTEDIEHPGIMNANLGMYRIQLSGNDYIMNQEIGLHYQLHRGIGVHQTKANKKGQPLKVSIFVGGPPSHSVAAVMPLPEGLSEMTFAGALGGRRFRYVYRDGFAISTDADFVITGEVLPEQNKPEGPFGDHLGYYSLTHPFPLMRVHKVYARKDAIWPFTVVGRPPQEDTSFGQLIHEITGAAIPKEIPGLKEVHAVDAAGVHPLLLAIGSERYTPYLPTKRPAELLTIANHILGTGQLSLAKFLFITADDHNALSTHNESQFLQYILERLHLDRDVHFYTHTTIDTLDYSGTSLNSGSKVVFAAYGDPIRVLDTAIPESIKNLEGITDCRLIFPGVVAIQTEPYTDNKQISKSIESWNNQLSDRIETVSGTPLLILCDDASFTAANIRNFLWVSFTRCNPSHDIHGILETVVHKHWGCKGPIVLDARIKPHHAPAVALDHAVVKKTDRLFEKGGSLYGKL
jgi:4-hydroxy-3-polyprenylbenzoate decarboxylase